MAYQPQFLKTETDLKVLNQFLKDDELLEHFREDPQLIEYALFKHIENKPFHLSDPTDVTRVESVIIGLRRYQENKAVLASYKPTSLLAAPAPAAAPTPAPTPRAAPLPLSVPSPVTKKTGRPVAGTNEEEEEEQTVKPPFKRRRQTAISEEEDEEEEGGRQKAVTLAQATSSLNPHVTPKVPSPMPQTNQTKNVVQPFVTAPPRATVFGRLTKSDSATTTSAPAAVPTFTFGSAPVPSSPQFSTKPATTGTPRPAFYVPSSSAPAPAPASVPAPVPAPAPASPKPNPILNLTSTGSTVSGTRKQGFQFRVPTPTTAAATATTTSTATATSTVTAAQAVTTATTTPPPTTTTTTPLSAPSAPSTLLKPTSTPTLSPFASQQGASQRILSKLKATLPPAGKSPTNLQFTVAPTWGVSSGSAPAPAPAAPEKDNAGMNNLATDLNALQTPQYNLTEWKDKVDSWYQRYFPLKAQDTNGKLQEDYEELLKTIQKNMDEKKVTPRRFELRHRLYAMQKEGTPTETNLQNWLNDYQDAISTANMTDPDFELLNKYLSIETPEVRDERWKKVKETLLTGIQNSSKETAGQWEQRYKEATDLNNPLHIVDQDDKIWNQFSAFSNSGPLEQTQEEEQEEEKIFSYMPSSWDEPLDSDEEEQQPLSLPPSPSPMTMPKLSQVQSSSPSDSDQSNATVQSALAVNQELAALPEEEEA